MHKKKILVIGPITAQSTELQNIIKGLSFLQSHYGIECIDPLMFHADVSNEEYYLHWQNTLCQYLATHDAFFGFSFGGVILQHCFSLFKEAPKPLVLFSTPAFADTRLKQQLTRVIDYCKTDQLPEALHTLYLPVFAPNNPPPQSYEIDNIEQAKARLIFGLSRALATDSRELLATNTIPYLHLIGEKSELVNRQNTMTSAIGRLIEVPGASMRVLQDNPAFCEQEIREFLTSEN